MLLLLLLVVVTKTVFCALADSSVNVRAGTAPHDCAMYAKICNSQCESARLTHHTILWYRRFSGIRGGWPRESLWCKWNAIDDVMTWKWIHLSNMWVLECTRLAIIEFASLVRLAKCKKKNVQQNGKLQNLYIFFFATAHSLTAYCFIELRVFHEWKTVCSARVRERRVHCLWHIRDGECWKNRFILNFFFCCFGAPLSPPAAFALVPMSNMKAIFHSAPDFDFLAFTHASNSIISSAANVFFPLLCLHSSAPDYATSFVASKLNFFLLLFSVDDMIVAATCGKLDGQETGVGTLLRAACRWWFWICHSITIHSTWRCPRSLNHCHCRELQLHQMRPCWYLGYDKWP